MDHAGSKDRFGSGTSGIGPAPFSIKVESSSMKCDPICTDRINSFALVSYIPGALGDFLDGLRKELVAACNPHAHVTLLTPRPLDCDFEAGREALAQRLDAFVPFRIDLLGVELFASTNVIYLAVGKGRTELEDMHKTLNS